MTRSHRPIASTLRKFSACTSSLEENGIAPILVTPSTTWAISGPKSGDTPPGGQRVFHDVVEQTARHRYDVQFQSARKSATSRGCTR